MVFFRQNKATEAALPVGVFGSCEQKARVIFHPGF
jgi:hypothetical protein